MDAKQNYSNEPTVLNEEATRAYERLGAKFGHAIAVKTPNGYQIAYCNQIISPKYFKDIKAVRNYMAANPYEFLPLMAHLYNERINEIKSKQNNEN